MYEHRSEPLLPRSMFLGRMGAHALGAGALVGGTLWVGMAGYHWLAGLDWIDSYLNAAMILGGMGPVAELHSTSAKLFAGTYALFAGIVFLVGVSVAFAPVAHRAMHRFHLDEREG